MYLDDIFIYINNAGQRYIKNIYKVLKASKNYSFFTKFKKYWFHKYNSRFLSYFVLNKEIRIKDQKVKIVKKIGLNQS